MYTIKVPPLAAIDEVNLTQAIADVAAVVQEGEHDSNQAKSGLEKNVSSQNRMFPRFAASYVEYDDGLNVIFS